VNNKILFYRIHRIEGN